MILFIIQDEFMIETRAGSGIVNDAIKSFARGEKRDFLLDIKQFVLENRIRSEFQFDELRLENNPTIFASNHFKRRVWDRLSIHPTHMFGNTRESLIVAGLVSVGAEELSGKSSSWLIKQEIRTKVGPITLRYAAMQKDFIETYDHISIPEVATRETVGSIRRQIKEKLERGKNIGVFAEEEPNHQMQEDGEILKNVLKILVKDRELKLQVVPVSMSYEGGVFVIRFSEPIQAGSNPREDAAEVIAAIASKLPESLRPMAV